MRISGFTILHNVVRLGYPFMESIRSLLPLVDELIVNVGEGDDGTWEAVQAVRDPRVKAFRSAWGPPIPGGGELSAQTNRALDRCSGDWAVYLQADEILHEDDLDRIRAAMTRHQGRDTEGLLFRYHHFWKDAALVADCWESFYPTAVRAVKTGLDIRSIGDACGFGRIRHGRARGLVKAHCGAYVYHYGWCNPPDIQAERIRNLRAIYAADPLGLTAGDMFWPLPLRRFEGSHPAVMRARTASLGSIEVPRVTRWPKSLRAARAILRAPASVRHWARPLLPVMLTNAWWRIHDLRETCRRPA